ncbi:ABC transporter permease [Streptomyces hoynatensis]|uniref:ABC transporter permease n=1 Tax=Streptomyces hoynatensis TaxID=1141874 RepID=A0A3A9Z769_9ACTN|nr:ABC transporter permease [Streptomyces hoynatensis]
MAAEWIKTRSLRSTPWLLGLLVVFVIGAATFTALDNKGDYPGIAPSAQRLRDAFTPLGFMTLILVSGSVGALSVAGEYGSGLIRTTTVAVPARGSVMLAKAVVQAVLWTAAGLLVSAGSFVSVQVIMNGADVAGALGEPGAPRALAAATLVAPVCALAGLGIGALLRHVATTVVVTTSALLLLPPFLAEDRRWSADLRHALIQPSWERLVDTWPDGGGPFLRPTVPGSWAVYVLWPPAAVAVAVLTVRRRDV